MAASKNDTWARHHHLYGLIHGAKGDKERALFELEKALAAEPYAEPRKRIEEACLVVHLQTEVPKMHFGMMDDGR